VTTNIIASTQFLKAHPDLVKKFLAAHVETVEFIKANPDEAKKLVNSEIERITTKALPTKVLDEAFKNVDVTYDPLPATLFKSAEDAFSLGFLGETKPDLANIYDLSLLNEVLKEKNLSVITVSP
jgi:NitT/TauT family transport system substrate-binding protein